MHSLWKTIAVTAFVTAHCVSGFGQTAEQPAVLIVETENGVLYRGDVTDATKLARDPGVTTPGPARAFQYSLLVSDIVAVNGKPAKGLQSNRTAALMARVNPQPGQTIADHDGNGPYLCFWQFQGPDGSWIGSLWDGGAAPAPGHGILGGNGAFLGVVGEHREMQWTNFRTASVTEDPANRRIHPGGKGQTTFRLYPKYRPAVDVSPAGPAVYHADFSLVTATSPARAGEVLIVAARNLGPTRPELLPPGARPFKADPAEMVNSPIEVTVNGKEAEVINKVGWPGTYDLYRVDFRVPAGLAPGLATIQLTAAWIPGTPVEIPVQ
jgi:hypothetical protein